MDTLAFVGQVFVGIGVVCAAVGVLVIAAVRLWSGDDSSDRGD